MDGRARGIGTAAARDGRGVPWRRVAIFAVKLVHSAMFLGIAASVLHVFYAGVANRGSRLTRVALGVALGESLVFVGNGLHCPLRTLAEDLGAESGQVTDIFLPRWFADRIPWFFTPPLVAGMVGLLWHRAAAHAVTPRPAAGGSSGTARAAAPRPSGPPASRPFDRLVRRRLYVVA